MLDENGEQDEMMVISFLGSPLFSSAMLSWEDSGNAVVGRVVAVKAVAAALVLILTGRL